VQPTMRNAAHAMARMGRGCRNLSQHGDHHSSPDFGHARIPPLFARSTQSRTAL
jgi:hypothetical protein